MDLQKYNIQFEIPSHIFKLSKIEITDNYTKLHKIMIPKTQHSAISSNKEQFIEDASSGEKYYLQNSSISIFPRMTILHSNSMVEIVETYPALNKTTKIFTSILGKCTMEVKEQ